MTARFVLGIDLGTTNSVLAYTPLDADHPTVQYLPLPQLTAPGTVENRSGLPSFLYLAAPQEQQSRVLDVPWETDRAFAVGEWARRQGAEFPQRTVSGAKSWLAYHRVDRRQAILPWNAPDEVPKISPLIASQRYLEHLIAAWHQAYPDAPVADQQVVLTVPASFDAAARELTREAALAAGLPDHLVLLEEPQAAVYAWLAGVGDEWRRLLGVGDMLLVCDVGGGTSDFTLVGVSEQHGELVLERHAVGNHLLVGGDNMDLALAHHAAGLFAEKGVQLDPWQSISLWHSCRAAKEALLAASGPRNRPLTVLGRGSRLIGGTVSVEIEREQVAAILADGFFPPCKLSDRPARQRASGFGEVGLPFEHDPAVTRHLAAFLTVQRGNGQRSARPTHVLFNGGVFQAEQFRERLLELLVEWFPGERPPQLLPGHHDLECAVAGGAAYYGWTKTHGGVRIRGGTARAYYIGIETAGLAVPGAPRPLRALCVVPLGMEEGTEVTVPASGVGLVVGEPVQFRFFSSATRRQDQPGNQLTAWTDDDLEESDSLEATLPADEAQGETFVPVTFRSRVTELGVLELWCVSSSGDQKWKLEFSVRDKTDE